MTFKFEAGTYYRVEDDGRTLIKDNTEDIIGGASSQPCIPRNRAVVAAAIRIEKHTHKDDDTQLWSSASHYKHDMDIGIMPTNSRTSAWFRNIAPGKSAIVSNLCGTVIFVDAICVFSRGIAFSVLGLLRVGDVVVLVVNWTEKVMYVRTRNGPVISACKIDDATGDLWVSCAMRGVGDIVRWHLRDLCMGLTFCAGSACACAWQRSCTYCNPSRSLQTRCRRRSEDGIKHKFWTRVACSLALLLNSFASLTPSLPLIPPSHCLLFPAHRPSAYWLWASRDHR
jgi:hypothetical protein